MKRWKKVAPRFRDKGCIKEFIDSDGRTYLVVRFPDGSVGVYKRKKGTGKAIADYEPIKGQKLVLRRLGATGAKGETTYELGRELIPPALVKLKNTGRESTPTLKKLIYRAEFFKEGDVYVGLCPELNVSSFGENIEDAKRSLHEAVEAFIETCEEMGTLEEVLEESGFLLDQNVWSSREPVLAENIAISQ